MCRVTKKCATNASKTRLDRAGDSEFRRSKFCETEQPDKARSCEGLTPVGAEIS